MGDLPVLRVGEVDLGIVDIDNKRHYMIAYKPTSKYVTWDEAAKIISNTD